MVQCSADAMALTERRPVLTRKSLVTPTDNHTSERLVRPQDIDGSLAVVQDETWAVTLQHIESDRDQPSKRTSLMWAGTDWNDPGDGFEHGGIRRSAVVGPLVENTRKSPFYCMILDEIRIDGVKADGAIWGRVTKSSGVCYEKAGTDLEAGRDATLDRALDFCTHSFGADGHSLPTKPLEAPIDRQRQSSFALANQVVILAFSVSSAPRVKDRKMELFAIRANLAEALFRTDFSVRGEQLASTLDHAVTSDCLEEIRSMIGNLPLVAPVNQRNHLNTLSGTFKRAGLRPLNANSHLSVDMGTSNDLTPEHVAKNLLATAGARKRIDSGWLSSRSQPAAPAVHHNPK